MAILLDLIPHYFFNLESLPDSKWITMLLLGLAMGFRHATDAEHVVAVSTIVSESKNIWKGFWIGASWGLGHSIPLLILGVIILKIRGLMDNYESIAHYFEFTVALMLIILGIQAMIISIKNKDLISQYFNNIYKFLKLPKFKIPHNHPHDYNENKKESRFAFSKPQFRPKSFVIGIIHSLAGSSAVMLILLPSINNFFKGILYILMFGFGTILSMSIMTLLLSFPFTIGRKNINLTKVLSGVAGILSITLGLLLGSDIIFDTKFIWY